MRRPTVWDQLEANLCKCGAPASLALYLMPTIHRFPVAPSLDPKDLEVAASVYAEVVGRLEFRPVDETTRESVAQSIIDSMLLGERDPMQLRERALAGLGRYL
jgi:hypothetical protein